MLTTFKQFNESKGGKMSIIWHASPNSNLFKLRATGSSKKLQAIPMEEAGLYVCPRFRDAVIWFLSYISGKKNNYSSLNPYKEGTIYKLEIPTVVLERSWYSENWEPEYFISEDDVKYIKILSKKNINIEHIFRMACIHKSEKVVDFFIIEKQLQLTEKTLSFLRKEKLMDQDYLQQIIEKVNINNNFSQLNQDIKNQEKQKSIFKI